MIYLVVGAELPEAHLELPGEEAAGHADRRHLQQLAERHLRGGSESVLLITKTEP